jgi:predicted ribosomally synthesized peptide with nif11-like leader
MSREQIDALGQKAARDPALAATIKAARTPADVAGIGAEHGCDFTEGELASYLGFAPEHELDDAALEAVGGGASDGTSAVHAGDLLLYRWQSSAGGGDISPWTVTHGGSSGRY